MRLANNDKHINTFHLCRILNIPFEIKWDTTTNKNLIKCYETGEEKKRRKRTNESVFNQNEK